MKTILITGGTSGIGKGLTSHFLSKGDYVIAVGSSKSKGEAFLQEAKNSNAKASFIQADLSLIKENERVIDEIKEKYPVIDVIIFCAAMHFKTYIETKEGFEFTFSLLYLSRFILAYGLETCLEKSANPLIINVCAPGMKGEVNWEDFQNKNNYSGQEVMFHSSRLNDLAGVAFSEKSMKKAKYILYNPWAVQTDGVMALYDKPATRFMMKLTYKIIGKPVHEAIKPIIKLIENPPTSSLSAFKESKSVSLNMPTFDKGKADRLYHITKELLKNN